MGKNKQTNQQKPRKTRMWLKQLNLRESSGAGTKCKDAEVGVRNADTVSDKTQHKAKDTGTDRLPVMAVSAISTDICPLVSLHHGLEPRISILPACLATVASTNESAHRRLRKRKRGGKTSLCLLGLMKTTCI